MTLVEELKALSFMPDQPAWRELRRAAYEIERLQGELAEANDKLTAYMRDNATICYQCGQVVKPTEITPHHRDGTSHSAKRSADREPASP